MAGADRLRHQCYSTEHGWVRPCRGVVSIRYRVQPRTKFTSASATYAKVAEFSVRACGLGRMKSGTDQRADEAEGE